jgi:hypothetical protein
MRRRCRLCDRWTVDDSIFCARHREAAQRFSLSFGKQEDGVEAPPDATAADESSADTAPPDAPPPEPPPPDEPTPETAAPDEAAVETTVPEPTAPAPTPTPEHDEERAVLAAAFHTAFDALRTRLKEHADPTRWPQLSIYFLNDALHCRAYFSIVPRTEDEPPAPLYALDEDRLHAALATGGAVFEELYARYAEHTEPLRCHTVQTVDVHFLTYAGLIAINSHPQAGKTHNLTTLKLDGDEFRKVELDDDVRALMRHDHW